MTDQDEKREIADSQRLKMIKISMLKIFKWRKNYGR